MGTIARELSNKSDEELKEWVEGGYICCVYLISFNNLVGMCLTTHPPQYYWGGVAEVKLTTTTTTHTCKLRWAVDGWVLIVLILT